MEDFDPIQLTTTPNGLVCYGDKLLTYVDPHSLDSSVAMVGRQDVIARALSQLQEDGVIPAYIDCYRINGGQITSF